MKIFKELVLYFVYFAIFNKLSFDFHRFYIRYSKQKNFLDLSIDGKVIIEVQFDENEELLKSDESHIILGSGNFNNSSLSPFFSYFFTLSITTSFNLYSSG